jgi:L-asparaginase II
VDGRPVEHGIGRADVARVRVRRQFRFRHNLGMIRLSEGVRLVEVERSSVVESVHTGHVVVLDTDGAISFQLGDPSQPILARSSLKPVQAAGMLRLGLRLAPAELALAASSHSGSPQHLGAIAAMLADAGLSEDDLKCPPDLPIGERERREYLASGQAERRLAMNCSGKHTAMLLTCLARADDPDCEWPLAGYLAPSHPLQRSLADTVAEFTGEPIAAVAVDGCGAPLFGTSLLGLARAFRRLATGTGPEALVAGAIRGFPDLVGGPGRQVSQLMRAVPGLIAKDGAEGVFAAALPDGGTVAVKIDDGATRAADCAIGWALHHLGVPADVLEPLARQPVLGGGEPVGLVRPAPGW